MKTSRSRLEFLKEVGQSLLNMTNDELQIKLNSIKSDSDISNILIEGKFLSSRDEYVYGLGEIYSSAKINSSILTSGSILPKVSLGNSYYSFTLNDQGSSSSVELIVDNNKTSAIPNAGNDYACAA